MGSQQLICVTGVIDDPRLEQMSAQCQSLSITVQTIVEPYAALPEDLPTGCRPLSAWLSMPADFQTNERQRDSWLGAAQRTFPHHLLVEHSEPMSANKMPASAFYSFGFRLLYTA